MNSQDYSTEQKKDITERVDKAHKMLEELNLRPGTVMTPVNVGDDAFALKAISYLQDTKYQNVISPIQNP